jgi:drug/metabolite transporter (DMT)-like permease
MFFLLLSFTCSAILILLFKVFERNGVPIFPAIVINYCTAATCGFIFLPNHHEVTSGAFIQQGWLPVAWVLGMMFITVFNLTSRTTVTFGVSTASVASKLGLVFPVLFAFLIYNESFNWLKLTGILLAFIAVVLSSLKDKRAGSTATSTASSFLPYLVFFGNGACDSVTQFANKHYLMHRGIEEFAMFIFVSAGATGLCILAVQIIRGKTKLQFKSIVGGICLGIPNYLSFLFLLKALATLNWGSSVIFPVTNLGTVSVATVVSYLLFKEKLSGVNLIGLLFAVAAIVLIVLSNFQ